MRIAATPTHENSQLERLRRKLKTEAEIFTQEATNAEIIDEAVKGDFWTHIVHNMLLKDLDQDRASAAVTKLEQLEAHGRLPDRTTKESA